MVGNLKIFVLRLAASILQAPVRLGLTWIRVFACRVAQFTWLKLSWHSCLGVKFLVHEARLLSCNESRDRGRTVTAIALTTLNLWKQDVGLVGDGLRVNVIAGILNEFAFLVGSHEIRRTRIFDLISNLV